MSARSLLTGGRGLALLAVLATILLAFASRRYAPPAPSQNAKATEFSGLRARATLARVLGDEAPHPVGSEAAAAVRARILRELESLGYQPREQKAFSCDRNASCAFVTNVVAELPSSTRESVLVASHYDSVPASSGANDDGAGVAAALEIARALKTGPPLPRSVLLLFDEGEEDGLLGARAFGESNPDASRVRAVVNVDARGSRGPATLFETTDRSAAIARLIAESVPRPVTSSLFFMIYKKMPNDTDFTALKPGKLGANFAFVGEIEHYHDPLDCLANSDAATLEHLGTGALGMIRALASGDPDEQGEAVWFDVLALGVVRWPEAWTRLIAGFAMALVAAAIALELRAGRLHLKALAGGMALVPAAALGAVSLSFALGAALDAAGAAPAPWTANGPWIFRAMGLAGIPIALASAHLLARVGSEALWAGTWSVLAALGAAIAGPLPGASYLLVVPALVAGACGITAAIVSRRAPRITNAARFVATAAPMLVLLALLSPVLLLAYDAMGTAAGPIAALAAAIPTAACGPVVASIARRTWALLPGAFVVATFAAVTIAATTPRFTPEQPSRVNVVHVQDGASARTLVENHWGGRPWGPVPPSMRAALGAAREAPRAPWSPETVLQADARSEGLPPPEVQAHLVSEAQGQRRLALHVRSLRHAGRFLLVLSADSDARVTRIEGRDNAATRELGWNISRVAGVPEAGFDLELAAHAGEIEFFVVDESSGLPPASAEIAAARPRSAVPTQSGDVTRVVRRVRL